MNQSLRTLLLASAALGLASLAIAEEAKKPEPGKAETKAAAKPEEKKAEPGKDYVILKLGTEQIKASEVLDVWKGLFPGGAAPDFETFDEKIRQNVLRGIVSEKLLYQEASKAGFDKNEDVKKRLAQLEKQVVMQAYMENKAKNIVTDAQLKDAYNKKVTEMKGQEEIRARHILVTSEDDAKAIIADLKKGGDFEKLAKEKSSDKGSGAQGGDLGYFTKDKMVKEFAEAAFKLKKGEVSEPVKTNFGWHVIKLEDRRKVTPPAFDEMKDELKAELSNKAMQDYVEGLLKAADISYFGADGKPRELSRKLDQGEEAPAP